MARLIGALLAAVLLAGCSTAGAVATLMPVADAGGWHTSLLSTTCTEYAGSMSPAEQVAAAETELAVLRRMEVSDASDGAEMAGAFVSAIKAACTQFFASDPTTVFVSGVTMAWMTNPNFHPVHH